VQPDGSRDGEMPALVTRRHSLGLAPRICFPRDCSHRFDCQMSLGSGEAPDFLPKVRLVVNGGGGIDLVCAERDP